MAEKKPMTNEALAVLAQVAKEHTVEVTKDGKSTGVIVYEACPVQADVLWNLLDEIERLRAQNQHLDSHAFGHSDLCLELRSSIQARYGELVPLPICTTPKAWANR